LQPCRAIFPLLQHKEKAYEYQNIFTLPNLQQREKFQHNLSKIITYYTHVTLFPYDLALVVQADFSAKIKSG